MIEDFHADIPISQKVYDFYKELCITLTKFPKLYKYTLGQKIDQTTLDLYELLFLATTTQHYEKSHILEKASSKLELLKVLIRLAKDTQCIETKKYIYLETFLQETGKMLGGWIKHTKHIT
jgi:hypothetical protein